MSSGESPPTYYFSGITFNPDFYTGTETYLTATTGKKHFLSYPTAQGTETIATLYSSKIDSSSGSTAFNFLESQTANLNIGNTTTGTTGQIIKIGPTATTAIVVGNLSITDNTINNATSTANRSVKIGDLQTDAAADLDLGTHVNRLGDINIGTGNTGSTPTINIGATVGTGTVRAGAIINIGRMTTSAITIGNTSADVTINSSTTGSIKTGTLTCVALTASGTITGNNGITIPVGKTLTANGGITTSTINTATGGSMAIGASSTGGITLGAAGAATTVSGSLTANAGISLASCADRVGIICNVTHTGSPGPTILGGYVLGASATSVTIPLTTPPTTPYVTTSVPAYPTLPRGIYIISINGTISGLTSTSYFTGSYTQTNCGVTLSTTHYVGGTASGYTTFSDCGILRVNNDLGGVVEFNGFMTGTAATMVECRITVTRIA